jgi:hypothetical protein
LCHDPGDLRAIGFGVAILQEAVVVLMRARCATGVLDGAPMALRSPGNLAGIPDDTIAIGAEGAVKLLKRIEIGEVMPVENQIIAAAHLLDLVNRAVSNLKCITEFR